MLPNGEIFTALLLSSSYSEKYKGRNMQPGEIAEIRLPCPEGMTQRDWRPKLLHRSGSREINVFIWLGDDSSDIPTVYFACAPLRKRMQFAKLTQSYYGLSQMEVEEQANGDVDVGAGTGKRYSVPMFPYCLRKVENLYSKYDFQSKVQDTMRQYPNHRYLFCGISHGAAVAQALALRLSLMYPRGCFQAVTWNAYRWTNEEGIALMEQHVGRRLLPFVMATDTTWDSIAGIPYRLSHMPRIVFLNADTGEFRPAESIDGSRLDISQVCCCAWRMYKLHFATTALKATKRAMLSSLRPHGNQAQPLVREDTIRWSGGRGGLRTMLRGWSGHGEGLAGSACEGTP